MSVVLCDLMEGAFPPVAAIERDCAWRAREGLVETKLRDSRERQRKKTEEWEQENGQQRGVG